MCRERGFSVLETMVALGVLAVLVAAAVPLCRTLLLDVRMAGAVDGLAHALHTARVRAHTGRQDTVVCRSLDGAACAGPGDWSSGWISFVNRDNDDPPVVDPGEPVLNGQQGPLPLSISSNRRAFVLRPYSLRATNGTVVFCDMRGSGSARAVIVSYTGRPRIARRTAAGGALACPG